MGKITSEILRIQIEEKITLLEVFEKYPHLAKLQLEEALEEGDKQKERKLLLD